MLNAESCIQYIDRSRDVKQRWRITGQSKSNWIEINDHSTWAPEPKQGDIDQPLVRWLIREREDAHGWWIGPGTHEDYGGAKRI
jgi:hypothetical protein